MPTSSGSSHHFPFLSAVVLSVKTTTKWLKEQKKPTSSLVPSGGRVHCYGLESSNPCFDATMKKLAGLSPGCDFPTQVVLIYLLLFACFQTARVAGTGKSNESSLCHATLMSWTINLQVNKCSISNHKFLKMASWTWQKYHAPRLCPLWHVVSIAMWLFQLTEFYKSVRKPQYLFIMFNSKVLGVHVAFICSLKLYTWHTISPLGSVFSLNFEYGI